MRTLVIRLLVFLALAGSANAQTTYSFNFSAGGTGSFVYDDVAMTANAISFDFGALGSIAPDSFDSQSTALIFGTPPTAAVRLDGVFFGVTQVAGNLYGHSSPLHERDLLSTAVSGAVAGLLPRERNLSDCARRSATTAAGADDLQLQFLCRRNRKLRL